MALLNPRLSHPVAFHERSYESDSGFSADDYSSVDPIAAASEITSVASRASKNKSVLKLNTRDDGTVITLDEKEVVADNVQDHGIEDDVGDRVEFQKDVHQGNPLTVSFQEEDEVQDARTRRDQKQSIHFVTRRIKASWLDNTYQKAIARARARLAKGNWPQYPEEWRLPHAPLPARPDLTRTGPITSLQGGYLEAKRNRKERRKRSETFPRTKSDAKSAERQAFLPPIDALYDSLFANLSASYPSHLLRKRWETAAAASSVSTSVSSDPNSTSYLPFIGTARLHPKELTPTVRRDDNSVPPKFCYGCTAELGNPAGVKAPLFFLDNPADDTNDDPGDIEHAQLVPQYGPTQQHIATTRVCYGCSLSKLPHIHVTKPRRVGGGYTMVRQAVEPYAGEIVKDGGSPQPSSYISALEEEERRQEERRRQLEEARQLRLEEEARRKEEEAERRKNLYKPPKAFQIKKTEKKVTESKDPFSNERNLNVPKSEGFKLKKTEKQTTKFVENTRQETEWKEPRKFELKKNEPKTTSTDWKPPERPERLRPKTPPPPPPPPKGKKPTVPIEPKKREPPKKKPDPPPPPPPKSVEKPKPVEKPKEPPPPKSKKQDPPKKPVAAAPPRNPTPPPPPKVATPPPPPREPSPPPPKEATPPPPKEPTPEPPPRDPTPPPPPKPKKEKLSKEYVKIPIIPYKTPDKDPPPPPKEESRPPSIPDPPVAPVQEVTPAPEPEPVKPISLPKKQPEPKAKVKPPKKTRRAKLPKRVRKEEKPLGVAAPMPERPPPSDPWVMPDTGPRVADVLMPAFPLPQPAEPQVPPLPEISVPAPAPKPPEEPAPEPQKLPMSLPKQPEPIMWRRRPEYKPKKKKWRKVEASNPPSSPDPAVRDPLDYLAKYCIVYKERVPHYQRIFNNHLRSTGISVQDRTLRHWMNSTTTDKAAGDHDGDDQSETASVTTEQSSGYGSAIVRSSEVNLEFKSDLEEFQGTFKTTPMEVNEDDYVSPMKLTENDVDKESGKGDGKDDDADSGRADSADSDSPERMLRARIASYGINDKFDVEERLDRSRFLLDRQAQKVTNLKEKASQLEASRTKAIADIARNEFLEIFRSDWDPEAAAAAEAKKKKDKKSKKKKDKDSKKSGPKSVIIEQADNSGASPPSTSSSSTSSKPTEAVKAGGFKFPVLKNGTDEWVLSRMSDKQVAMAESDAEVCRLTVSKQITEERLEAANKQIKELEGEKKMLEDLETKMKENELSDRMASKPDFRRKQSTLFNMMNQEQPHEIETNNVENLLQKVNSHLISEKECQYVYHVLDLPQRHRIDFKLFTIVAALSEKISRLDPFIKKLINKINFEALDVKMARAKELFYLLEDEEETGFPGEVPVRNLQVELEAGGLKREHVDLVMTKFNREGKGTVDFLDFLTYIPLFIDLHENIVSDPLYASIDL